MTDQSNTIDAAEAKRFVAEIEGCLEELLSLRGTYMADCKAVREQIKGWKDQANDAGVPRKALNIELKRRELEKKIAGLIEDADEDDAALANQIREALGDYAGTPLGQAALGESGEAPTEAPKPRRGRKAKAAEPADKSAALDEIADDKDVRPRFMQERDMVSESASEMAARRKDREEAERVAENVERLAGIKTLN